MRKCFYNTNLSESSTGSRPAFTTIETVGNKIRVISVKNAIWSAVPNIGVIVAGDPVTVGLSLATHIEARCLLVKASASEGSIGTAGWQYREYRLCRIV